MIGANINYVTNDRFARAENLLSEYEPVFDPELFCAQGKVMDSWESSRHNDAAYHVLRCTLKAPSSLNYAWISTKFHDGNQVEFVRLLARENSSSDWQEVLPKTHLLGHSEIKLRLAPSNRKYSEVEVQAYPDGGLTRLGLYSELPKEEAAKFDEIGRAVCVRFKELIPKTSKPLVIPYSPTETEIQKNRLNTRASEIDQASLGYGGEVVHVSNEHYGPGAQVISPYVPLHMFDGFESARSRDPDHHEQVQLRLARAARIRKVRFDFKYFVNNNPRAVSIFGKKNEEWVELTPKIPVKAFAGNQKDVLIGTKDSFSELMIKVFPDGGINRIHVFTD
jgi:allantoicase